MLMALPSYFQTFQSLANVYETKHFTAPKNGQEHENKNKFTLIDIDVTAFQICD